MAGTGEPGFSGDDGPATDARLNSPAGVAVGFGGRLLIADSGNNRIRELSPTGAITTVAGTGDLGYLGDGGPGTSAEFEGPQGVVVDAEDALLIADTLNDRIRRIEVDGIITTVARNGLRGFAGDGKGATDAAIDLATGPLNSDGQAIAVDAAAKLFIADALNNELRSARKCVHPSRCQLLAAVAASPLQGAAPCTGVRATARRQQCAANEAEGNRHPPRPPGPQPTTAPASLRVYGVIATVECPSISDGMVTRTTEPPSAWCESEQSLLPRFPAAIGTA